MAAKDYLPPTRVKVRVSGVHPEDFINFATANGIKMWAAEPGLKSLIFTTDAGGFSRLGLLQSQRDFSWEKISEGGLAALLKRALRRKSWLAGFFVFCLAIYYLSGLIWAIELEGLAAVDEGEILDYVATWNLKQWGQIRRLDYSEIEQALYIRFPRLAWVAIEKNGVKIKIKMAEKEYSPFQFGAIVDIVAEYDGIIFEMMVLKGTAQVEPGMTVAKGDLLIAGYREGEDLVNAAGSVRAKVFIEGWGEAALEEAVKSYTGRKKQISILSLAGREIPLSRKPDYPNYEVEQTVQTIYGGVALVRRLYTEVNVETRRYTPAEAAELARLRASVAAHAQLEEQALILAQESSETDLGAGFYGYRVLLTIETNIGCERVRIEED